VTELGSARPELGSARPELEGTAARAVDVGSTPSDAGTGGVTAVHGAAQSPPENPSFPGEGACPPGANPSPPGAKRRRRRRVGGATVAVVAAAAALTWWMTRPAGLAGFSSDPALVTNTFNTTSNGNVPAGRPMDLGIMVTNLSHQPVRLLAARALDLPGQPPSWPNATLVRVGVLTGLGVAIGPYAWPPDTGSPSSLRPVDGWVIPGRQHAGRYGMGDSAILEFQVSIPRGATRAISAGLAVTYEVGGRVQRSEAFIASGICSPAVPWQRCLLYAQNVVTPRLERLGAEAQMQRFADASQAAAI
jgi:hypothetical protein